MRSASWERRAEGPVLWKAGLVCPVRDPPIRQGGLLVRDGRITAVGTAHELRERAPRAEVRDCPEGILIPGLVNAHTHLELTRMPRLPSRMGEWIVELVREARRWTPERFADSARAGVRETLAAGVTCVGDVTSAGESEAALREAGLRGVVFHEVLGLDPADAARIARKRLPPPGGNGGRLRVGVSPHAPYTTSIDLYRRALAEARARGWRSATHLAESPAETRFLDHGGGPFSEMHHALRSPLHAFRAPGKPPVRLLEEAGLLPDLGIAVHCNRTVPAEWDALRRAGVAVCLCPRTAAFFGHPFADVWGMRVRGLHLCLGTDSRASSPSLSLLEEAAALWREEPSLSADKLLAMCTYAGAAALGFADEGAGALVAGGVADFALLSPAEGSGSGLAALFRPGAEVKCTVIGGEVRWPSAGQR